MAMICQNCGSEIKDVTSKFCSNCGATIERISSNSTNNEQKKDNTNQTKTLLNMDSKTEAIILYLFNIIGLIAMFIKDREYNEFSMFHYKQTATLFIIEAVIGVFGSTLSFLIIPIIFSGLATFILFVFQIGACIRAYQGEKYEIPIIKDISKKIWG